MVETELPRAADAEKLRPKLETAIADAENLATPDPPQKRVRPQQPDQYQPDHRKPAHPVARHRPNNPRERSEEHTSELQSHSDLVCRLLLEKKNKFIADSRP